MLRRAIISRRAQSGYRIVGAARGVPLMCKYVRREIRDLTPTDRKRFLDALEVRSSMPWRTYGWSLGTTNLVTCRARFRDDALEARNRQR